MKTFTDLTSKQFHHYFFKILCLVIILLYSNSSFAQVFEDFSSGIPVGWNVVGAFHSTDPAFDRSGVGGSVVIPPSFGNYLETPEITDITDISFFLRDEINSGGYIIEVLFSDDNFSSSTFLTDAGGQGLTFQEITATLSTPATGKIRIFMTGGDEGAIIDDFTINQVASPLNLVQVNFTGTAQNSVDRDSNIELEFDANVSQSSIDGGTASDPTDDAIQIKGEQTGRVAGVYSGDGTTTITFNPDEDFKPGEVITVTLTDGVQGTGGGVGVSTIFQFTTAPDPGPGLFPLAENAISTNADGAIAVYAADVDGDGDLDVLSASRFDNKIAWYENDGSGTFTEQVISTNADFARSVYATDVDGDGDLDVLSASQDDDKIGWYENDGTEAFTEQVISINANGAQSVYAADVDGDGDLDVLSASQDDDKIAWYENDGSQAFTEQVISINADFAWSVYAADVDGDGDLDVLSASRLDDKIAWYENDGNQTFTEQVISTSADDARSVYAADVDGDGDLDVLSASQDDDKIAWYANDGSQTFTEQVISTNADGAESVYAADVDGDGDLDVLSASLFDDKIAWYENDGSQTFTEQVISTAADAAQSVYAADVDDDGDLDVLSASNDDDKIAWYAQAVQPITFNSATPANNALIATDGTITLNFDAMPAGGGVTLRGSVSGPIQTVTGITGNSLDIDPLLPASYHPGEEITVTLTDTFLGDNGGELSNPQTLTFNVQPDLPSLNFNEVTAATGVDDYDNARFDWGDYDKDGDPDLLITGENASLGGLIEAQVYRNDGNFTFTEIGVSLTGVEQGAARWVDWDNDNDLDIYISGSDNSALPSTFLYEQTGTDQFTLVSGTITGLRESAVDFGDLDNDGDLDFVQIGNDGIDPLTEIYENDGSGNFSSGAFSGSFTDFERGDVALSDFSNDGLLDIAIIANDGVDRNINFATNNGDETFTVDIPGLDGAFATDETALDWADFDEDGDLDLLWSGNEGSDFQTVILSNDGSPGTSYTDIEAPFPLLGGGSVQWVDYDSDGDLDAISTGFDFGLGTITRILDNQGSDDFTDSGLSIKGFTDGGLQLVDINGDGVLDVFGAGFNDTGSGTFFYEGNNAAPLEITESSPAANDNNVAQNANITLTFDANVSQSSIDGGTASDPTDDAIQIKGEQTGLVAGVYSGDGTTTLTFNPDEDFKPGEVVTVTLTDGVLGTSGEVGVPTIIQFTTAPDPGLGLFPLAENAISTTADGAISVYAADVDGDGDLDVLSASQDDDKIAWYENDGSQAFTEQVISTTADGAWSVYAADVDGDGDLDVLSASNNDSKIAWYANDGSQTFTEQVISTTAAGAVSVYAADVDGDGDLDVLSASFSDDKIAWYENDGSETFTEQVISTTAAGAESVYAADVDGDGDLDVLSASNNDNKIAWYENNGSQTFTEQVISTTADFAQSVYAADVDGDGDLDVLSASNNDNKIAWYENDGSQTFTEQVISTTADGAESVYAADVNGDGDLDVLSASPNDDKIAWYANNGSENFTEQVISTTAVGAESVYAADVDGDGDLDVVSASLFDDKIAWYAQAANNNFPMDAPPSNDFVQLSFLGRFDSGAGEGAAEISAYDPVTQRLFVLNDSDTTIDVVDLSDPANPAAIDSLEIDASTLGGGVNHIEVNDGLVALAVENDDPVDPGFVYLFDTEGGELASYTVGVLPDMLTYTPDGGQIVVANEGEPNNDYTEDPEGSVSIVDLRQGITNAVVRTIDFTAFNGREDQLRAEGIRIFGPNATVAQDLEPEFITINQAGTFAYVACQENNALAIVDILQKTVVDIVPLGFKDWSNLLIDASDEDNIINLVNYNVPLFGMYQPDGIASFTASDGQTYIVTANEGDARDYDGMPGFEEEARVADVMLDTIPFPDSLDLQQVEALGRLKITTTLGDVDNDGSFEALYAFGGRSFSIWDSEGNLVWDSEDQFARISANQTPDIFNANDGGVPAEFDQRSDDKGSEPEGITVGVVDDRIFAFVGLERQGGFMVYDITDPFNPQFQQYVPQETDMNGDPIDASPEGLLFIDGFNSPNGNPLLVASHEVSGTVSIYEFKGGPTPEERDSLALVALYESTDGDNWTNNNNWLTGPVSNWFGVTVDNGRVTAIDLTFNGLSGSLPLEITELSGLAELNLSENTLTGTIPEGIGSLISLQFLDLSDNALNGPVPEEIGGLEDLVEVDLALNLLSGSIPETIGNLSSLEFLALDNNLFNDELPESLGSLSELEVLTLSHNKFSGSIPESLADLDSLLELSISFNQFTDLPDLSDLDLDVFDVTNNLFTFEDLQPNSTIITNVTPQQEFGVKQLFILVDADSATADNIILSGDTIILDPQLPGSGSLDNYQWLLNGSPVTGTNSPTLEIANVGIDDVGTYILEVQNDSFPGDSIGPKSIVSKPIVISDFGLIATDFTDVQKVAADNRFFLEFSKALDAQTLENIKVTGNHSGILTSNIDTSAVADGLVEVEIIPPFANELVSLTIPQKVLSVDGNSLTNPQTIEIRIPTPNAAGFYSPVSFAGSGIEVFQEASFDWSDFDGDGDLDLAIAGFDEVLQEPVSVIYENEGDNMFVDLGATLTGVEGSFALDPQVEWLDFNRDGNLDLLLSGLDVNVMPVTDLYQGDGAGGFTLVSSGLDDIFGSLAVGDYDNDGDPDIALTGLDAGLSLSGDIYENVGGSYLPTFSMPVLLQQGSLTWVDFDGDGDLDLEATGSDGADARIIFSENLGHDAFRVFTPEGIPGFFESNTDWADVDGDGDMDVAVLGSVEPGVFVSEVYLNDGDGKTFSALGTGLFELTDGSIQWGDYDADNDLDLLVSGFGGPDYTATTEIFENLGDGVFISINSKIAGFSGGRLAWADWDSDMDLDIFASGFSFEGLNNIPLVADTLREYDVLATTFALDTFSNATEVFTNEDELVGPEPVGFEFEFFGETFEEVYIGDNGFITFLPDQDPARTPDTIPDPASPNAIVAGYWEDLTRTIDATIRYKTIGDSSNKVFIVEYSDLEHFDNQTGNPDGNIVTMQIKLFEGTNNIEVHCADCQSNNDPHVQGIENSTGTSAYFVEGRNFVDFSLTNDAVLFRYNKDRSDSLIMVAFYQQLDGDNWLNNDGWLSGPIDTWFGLGVDAFGRVDSINLENNGLSGSITEALANMDLLQFVDLSGNSITGDADLLGLEGLQDSLIVDLSDNFIVDAPDLSGVQLNTIDLSLNRLNFFSLEPNLEVDGLSLLPTKPLTDDVTLFFETPDDPNEPFIPQDTIVLDATLAGDSLTQYQWFRDSIPLPGDTTQILELLGEPSNNGVYFAEITNPAVGDGEIVLTTGLFTLNERPFADENEVAVRTPKFTFNSIPGFLMSVNLGDMNMDGKDDLGILTNHELLIYADGFAQNPTEAILADNGQFFREVRTGDFNGDGMIDFAINSDRDNEGTQQVDFYLCVPTDTAMQVDATIFAEDILSLDDLGSVGSTSLIFNVPGDINNDGIDDVALFLKNTEQINIYLGAANLDSVGFASPDTVLNQYTVLIGLGNGDVFTGTVRINGLGDINGDSIDDFAISDLNRTIVTDSIDSLAAGAVYVHFGDSAGMPSNMPDTVLFLDDDRVVAEQIKGFGFNVKGVDLNGDRINDVLVSAVQSFDPASITGEGGTKLFIYYGSADFDNAIDSEVKLPTNFFGKENGLFNPLYAGEILTVQDINRDGAEELIFASTGLESLGLDTLTNAFLIESNGAFNERDIPSVLFEAPDPSTGLGTDGFSGMTDVESISSTDTYNVLSGDFDIQALSNPVEVIELSTVDDIVTQNPVPLGFDFEFFEETYDSVYVSSNGFITFLPGQDDGCCQGAPIPNQDNINGFIAAFWEDTNASVGGQIVYETVGSAPNRVFLLDYMDVPLFDNNNIEIIFQIKLFEGSNNIEIHCAQCLDDNDGLPATQGIENQDGTVGFFAEGRSAEEFELMNDAILFKPGIGDIFNQMSFQLESAVGNFNGDASLEVILPQPFAPSGPAYAYEVGPAFFTPVDERNVQALVDFYNAAGGPEWADNSGWLIEEDVRDWFGVEVTQFGEVIGLTLSDNLLDGFISPSINAITTLERLDLSDNNLTDEVPIFTSLRSLNFLDLSSNDLTGSIDFIQTLTGDIRLDSNQFDAFGTIDFFGFTEDFDENDNVVSGGGSRLFVATKDSIDQIQELDPSTGDTINSFATPEPIASNFNGLAFDGQFLYYIDGSGTNTLYQLDVNTGAINDQTNLNISNVDGLAHSGELIYATNGIGVFVIDFETGIIDTLTSIGFSGDDAAITYAGSRNTLFSGTTLGLISEIDPFNDQIINQFTIDNIGVFGLGYSSTTNLLYVGDDDVNGEILVVDPNDGTILDTLTQKNVVAMAADESGSFGPFMSNSLTLENNRFDFGDFEPVIDNIDTSRISFVPQLPLTDSARILVEIGSDTSFTVFSEGSANEYQWLLNDTLALEQETDSVITFIDIDTDIEGTYKVVITNENVPQLTLESGNFILIPSSLERDRAALTALYNSTGGPEGGWIDDDNWIENDDVSVWFGVKVANNRVVKVILPNNNLTGAVPDQVAEIGGMTFLDLSGNELTRLPSFEIIRNLDTLNISNNRLLIADIENNLDIDSVAFSPQKIRRRQDQIDTLRAGTSRTLLSNARGTNNTFSWYFQPYLTTLDDSVYLSLPDASDNRTVLERRLLFFSDSVFKEAGNNVLPPDSLLIARTQNFIIPSINLNRMGTYKVFIGSRDPRLAGFRIEVEPQTIIGFTDISGSVRIVDQVARGFIDNLDFSGFVILNQVPSRPLERTVDINDDGVADTTVFTFLGGYDSLLATPVSNVGSAGLASYLLDSVILGNYVLSATDIDDMPEDTANNRDLGLTYLGDPNNENLINTDGVITAEFWESARRLSISSNLPPIDLGILLAPTPFDSTTGNNEAGGRLILDDGRDNGRIQRRRGGRRVRVSLRRRRRARGRPQQDEGTFVTVANVETNDEGRYNFDFIPNEDEEGLFEYRIRFEIPGFVNLIERPFVFTSSGQGARLDAVGFERLGYIGLLGPEMITGIKNTFIRDFSMYPNPVTGNKVFVHYNITKAVNSMQLEIYTASGNRILNQSLDATFGSHLEELNIEKLESGMYILMLTSPGNSFKEHFRFIIK